jgi:hypothetical protein
MRKIGKEVLFIPAEDGNPRNGEGSMIRLCDGRIMYAYTRYYGDELKDDSIACIAAYYSSDEGESWENTSVTQVADFKLKLDKRNFKTYEYTTDGNSVNATIAPENVKSVLGISISAASDVKVSITTNGTFLNRITITYKTTDGASVAVDTSYTYAPVTLDF